MKKRKSVYGYVFILLWVMTTSLYGQVTNRTISGIVVDETGEPLTGATVMQVRVNNDHSANGVIVDVNGHFSLTVPDATEYVEVSYIGFEKQRVRLTNEQSYRIVMQSDSQALEDVVVTGMFTRNANTFTGAVTTIKKDELMNMGNQNILQSLKSADPSFMMIENLAAGSNPNATPSFQMRGQSSFPDLRNEYQRNPNEPLFILDGFETELTKVLDLDMNLVESVTLLKDATAKAIYGAKAANGVVVIETRRPEAGKMRINYTGDLNLEIPDLTSYNLANAAEKLAIEKMAGIYTSDRVPIQLALDQKYNDLLIQVLGGVDTDWLAQPVRTGVGQKHSVYLEGGDQYMVYGVDLSYNKVIGAMKGSGRDTFSGGVQLSYKTENFLFRNKLSVTHNVANDSPWGEFSNYASMNPYNRIYDDEGQLIQTYEYSSSGETINRSNPIWNSMINTKYQSKYTDITNNFYAEWFVRPNLKLTARFGITYITDGADNFKPGTHTDFVNYISDEDIYRKGKYIKENGITTNLNGDLGISYSLERNKHVFFFNGQWTITSYSKENSTLVVEGFPNDNMDHISFGTQYEKDGTPDGNETVANTLGGVASINYSYDNRYLVDINYRLTGSSEYGTNNRWGSFWSVGAGWNLHEEDFLNENRWINRLKFRVSTGYTGSQGYDNYDALATLKYYTDTSYGRYIGSYVTKLANPDLQWQKKYDQNFGIDFIFLNNKLSGRFDYYLSTTKNMLTYITLPQSTGFTTYRENLGETDNKGFEANLNYRILEHKPTKSFLNIFASIAHNKNKLKSISNSLRAWNDSQNELQDKTDEADNKSTLITPLIKFEQGQSISAIWAVRSLGIDPVNGKEIFLTKEGDVTYQYSAQDQVVCGDTQPKLNGTFGLGGEYMNFGLNVIMSFQLGGQIYNKTLVDKVENADLYYNVDNRVFSDRWQKEGDIARFKAINDQSYTRPTSRFVEDYNILTFSSINLYYDFRDTKFVRNSFLTRLKLQLYLNEFATISSVKIERGTDYPFARNLSLSLQANF